jgi:hypothetical protein
LPSISNPFKSVDFSDLPELKRYSAKNGAMLAYRYDEPVDAPLIAPCFEEAPTFEKMEL